MSEVSKKKNMVNAHNSTTFKLKLTKEKEHAEEKNNPKEETR